MKRTWRCDFCDETGTKWQMNKHEPNCVHNPARQLCYTCKYYLGSLLNQCAIEGNCYAVLVSGEKCPLWGELSPTPFIDEVIDDGAGGCWSDFCRECGEKAKTVIRPGKVQCMNCG